MSATNKEDSALPWFILGIILSTVFWMSILLVPAVEYTHLKNKLIQENMAQYNPKNGEWELILPTKINED